MKSINKKYIWLLPLSIIFFKWTYIFYCFRNFDFDINFINFNDVAISAYISLSDLNYLLPIMITLNL